VVFTVYSGINAGAIEIQRNKYLKLLKFKEINIST